MYLPATDDLKVTWRASACAAASRAETILVIEDQPSVRAFMRDALGRYGYRVIEAADAQKLGMFERNRDSIDLVVTDVIMPGKTGPELVDQMFRSAPT